MSLRAERKGQPRQRDWWMPSPVCWMIRIWLECGQRERVAQREIRAVVLRT